MNKKYWVDDEIKMLFDLYIVKGLLRKDISVIMNRSEASIAKKIKILKLKRPENLKKRIKKESNIGEKNGMYRKVGWCKGLTKENDERIKLRAEKLSKTRKRLFKEGELDTRGEKNGMYGKHSWNAGLSKEHDIRLKQLGEKTSKTKKENWKNMSDQKKEVILIQLSNARKKCKSRNRTRIEYFIENILEKENIIYESEKSMGVYIVDFFIPSKNLVIECMGDYWHANPKIFIKENYTVTQKNNTERDKRKKEFLEKRGLNIKYLWEYDINNYPNKIIKELKQLIV
jgi:very-short-patch-repair endonuclease